MTIDANTTQETFDRLFDQLLSTLSEQNDLRSRADVLIELAEVKDRLHAIRAELAIARREISAHAIESAPVSNTSAPECDCHAIAAEHPWGIGNLAA